MAPGKTTYRFDPATRDDLRQGVFWYEERREGLGARFAAEVQRAISLLVAAPSRWPVRSRTHRYVLRGFPYTIAYRVANEEVVIVAVAHHRLDPGSWDRR